ncbi:hypothetical protein HKX48_005970 [Thoreauomyces humboldtii]|nr:hypothetical protein HKX48_005970 [Thoreauomyces humboldtii]
MQDAKLNAQRQESLALYPSPYMTPFSPYSSSGTPSDDVSSFYPTPDIDFTYHSFDGVDNRSSLDSPLFPDDMKPDDPNEFLYAQNTFDSSRDALLFDQLYNDGSLLGDSAVDLNMVSPDQETSRDSQQTESRALDADAGIQALLKSVKKEPLDEAWEDELDHLFDEEPFSAKDEGSPDAEASQVTSRRTLGRRRVPKADPDQARRRSSRVYPCPLDGCLKTFTRKFNLATHIETHNPERSRPFICPDCRKAFLRAHDLERHETVHSKVKAYTCPDSRCSKRFTRADAVRRHLRKTRCEDPEEV